MRSVNPSEHQIQCAIVEWASKANTKYGKNKIGEFLIKNANEGKRSWSQGKKMKAEGLKKGVSDLFLAIPVSDNLGEDWAHGFWIEVKSKKGKLSEPQENWIALMIEQKYEAKVVFSVDEGIQAIKDYLGIR